jgi:hypothetical protein
MARKIEVDIRSYRLSYNLAVAHTREHMLDISSVIEMSQVLLSNIFIKNPSTVGTLSTTYLQHIII